MMSFVPVPITPELTEALEKTAEKEKSADPEGAEDDTCPSEGEDGEPVEDSSEGFKLVKEG